MNTKLCPICTFFLWGMMEKHIENCKPHSFFETKLFKVSHLFIKTCSGHSPFHFADKTGNFKVYKFLVPAGIPNTLFFWLTMIHDPIALKVVK